MRTILCICVFLVLQLSPGEARWSLEQYDRVENLLIGIQGNVERLYNYIYLQKVKDYGESAPNGSYTGGQIAAHSSFVNEIEARLSDIENATGEIATNMRMCQDSPLAPAQPTNVRVESTTQSGSSSIVVKWDPLVHTPENLQWKVYFQPMEPDGTYNQPEVVFRICDGRQTSASITDLSPRHYYNVKVGAVDGTIVESHSMTSTVRTPDIIPSKVGQVTGENIGPNRISLSWNPPTKRGEIVAYKVYHYDTFMDKNFTYDVMPPKPNYIVDDLTEGVDHVFSVSALSDNGESKPSDPVTVSAMPYFPRPVDKVKMFVINATTIKVTFQKLQRPLGKIRGYTVRYDDYMGDKGSINLPPDTQVTDHVFSGLRPNNVYFVSVDAFTRRMIPPKFSNLVQARTDRTVPTPVRGLICNTLRNDPPMINLRWKPPKHLYLKDGERKWPRYHIFWGVDKGVFRNETIKNYSVSWNSDYLDDNLGHTFIIAAENAKGLGGEVEVKLKTPNREFQTPTNIVVNRVRRGNQTSLHVTWDRMAGVAGFRVLHRVFHWIYVDRWIITEVDDPDATGTIIPIYDTSLSYIVVVRAKPRKPKRKMNRWGQPYEQIKQIQCNITYYPERTHRAILKNKPAKTQ